jgi:riboflavin-specific deaminase-like protein
MPPEQDDEAAAWAFLAPLLAERARWQLGAERPWTTLTYAQSLDGFIAAPGGRPLALSGDASRLVTHALRATHDALLVGLGTVLADAPALSTRLLSRARVPPEAAGWISDRAAAAGEKASSSSSSSSLPSPRPVVVDGRLALARQLSAARSFLDRAPLILCAGMNDASQGGHWSAADRAALEAAGAVVVPVPAAPSPAAGGRIDLPRALALLARPPWSLRSVMVEGGARIIASLLAAAPGTVDALVVTLAPRYLGAGVPCAPLADAAAAAAATAGGEGGGLACVRVRRVAQLGADVVLHADLGAPIGAPPAPAVSPLK